MATFDIGKIRSFYGSKSAVWYAPAGTARPVGMEEVPTGYTLVGALSSKGVGENREVDTESENIWQGAVAFENVSSATMKVDFEAMEHTGAVFDLLNNSEIEVMGEYSEQVVAVGEPSPVREFVVDAYDGNVLHRMLFRGKARMSGEKRFEAGKASFYPVEITVEGATAVIRTNDPNF